MDAGAIIAFLLHTHYTANQQIIVTMQACEAPTCSMIRTQKRQKNQIFADKIKKICGALFFQRNLRSWFCNPAPIVHAPSLLTR